MAVLVKEEALARALARALLVLRITHGLFLLQWGVEKFVALSRVGRAQVRQSMSPTNPASN